MSQYHLSQVYGVLCEIERDLRKRLPKSWVNGGLKPDDAEYAEHDEFVKVLSTYQERIVRSIAYLSQVDAALDDREARVRGMPRDLRYRDLQSVDDLRRCVGEIREKARAVLSLLWSWSYNTQQPRITDIMKDCHDLLHETSEQMAQLDHAKARMQIQRNGPVVDCAKAETVRELTPLFVLFCLVAYALQSAKRKARARLPRPTRAGAHRPVTASMA